jgi:hypothetical protein
MSTELDRDGLRLLNYLYEILLTIDPDTLVGLPTYDSVRTGLRLPSGRPDVILEIHGMTNLADWAKENNKPPITGLIIAKDKGWPGAGFFKFYRRDPEDFQWWSGQVKRIKQHDWISEGLETTLEGRQTQTKLRPQLSERSRKEADRLIGLIEQRVGLSGSEITRVAPTRYMPDSSKDFIRRMIGAEPLLCGICSGPIPLDPANEMLKPSVDRIDSSNTSYSIQNIQLTHYGCNLAKNQFTQLEARNWLAMIRAAGADPR